MQNSCEIDQLNVCHETLSSFNSLNCIFIDIQTCKLKHIGKLPLRLTHPNAVLGNLLATDIIAAIKCFVCEH